MAFNAVTKGNDALVAGTALTSSITIPAIAPSAYASTQHVTRRKKQYFAQLTQKNATFASLIASSLVFSQQHLQQHTPRRVPRSPRSTPALRKQSSLLVSLCTTPPSNNASWPRNSNKRRRARRILLSNMATLPLFIPINSQPNPTRSPKYNAA
jgi:hypothetical protein